MTAVLPPDSSAEKLDQPQQSPRDLVPLTVDSPSPSVNVLVIDDDEDDFVIVRDLCDETSDQQISVEWRSSYDSGLRSLLEGPYDVCLVDYRLGHRTGLELIQEALAQQCRKPMILLTGQGERKIDMQAMRVGAADYLDKAALSASLLERSIRYAIAGAQANAALHVSEERFALAARGANDGIWDWNLESGKIFFSTRCTQMLGWDDPGKLRTPADWYRQVHNYDRERLKQELLSHLEGTSPHFQCEYRVHHRDGSYRWFLTRGIAVRKPSGEPHRIAGSHTDITNRREAEEQLLSHVSHELRTPLNAMYQYVSLLSDGLLGETSAEQKEVLDRVLQNSRQLRGMINDLMDSSRISNGKFLVSPARVLLPGLIFETLPSLMQLAKEKKITLDHEIQEELPVVYADADRIRQVLSNLVGNALKFTPSGGRITVCAKLAPQKTGAVVVSVKDTGDGIHPEACKSIFERLHQESTSNETSRKGLGLGLHICREIVTRHGGDIWVESVLGEGSTFFFTLPLFSPAQILQGAFKVIPRGRSNLGLITLKTTRKAKEPSLGSMERTANEVRRILKRSIIPELDVLLPSLTSDHNNFEFHIVSFSHQNGVERMGQRLLERLQSADELCADEVEISVKTAAQPLPKEIFTLPINSALRKLGVMVADQIGSSELVSTSR